MAELVHIEVAAVVRGLSHLVQIERYGHITCLVEARRFNALR